MEKRLYFIIGDLSLVSDTNFSGSTRKVLIDVD
jgi:hypothetical protein